MSRGNFFDEDHIFIFKIDHYGYIDEIVIDWDHAHFVAQL